MIRNGNKTHFTPHRFSLRKKRSASSTPPQGGSEKNNNARFVDDLNHACSTAIRFGFVFCEREVVAGHASVGASSRIVIEVYWCRSSHARGAISGPHRHHGHVQGFQVLHESLAVVGHGYFLHELVRLRLADDGDDAISGREEGSGCEPGEEEATEEKGFFHGVTSASAAIYAISRQRPGVNDRLCDSISFPKV